MAYLVVVRKGPTWELNDIEPYCRLLSRRFIGEVWAYGSYEADILIGRMRLRVVADRPFQDIANRLRFARRTREWVKQLRAAQPRRLAVVALEPFTGGSLALYAARRAHGTLICEVNGVYASHHNIPKTRKAIVRTIRVLARRLVGAYVLHRATAVRLLFAGQLKGFVCLPDRVITRQFFDITNVGAFRPGTEEPIILSAGFPFRVKGFDLLCTAFSRLADRYPEWKLVLIGHRVPEELVEGGFVHPRIEGHPGVKHPQLADWMARCAIFALPSRTEAMGRVLLEAGAARKCRLASRVDGIPTVIEDGVDGLLVDAESVDQLEAALEQLMRDATLRQSLGQAAKRRVDRDFSDEAYLSHYAELVSMAVGREQG